MNNPSSSAHADYDTQIKHLREHVRVSLPLLTLQPEKMCHYMTQYAGINKIYDWVDASFTCVKPAETATMYTQRFHTLILFPGNSIAVRFNDAAAHGVIPASLRNFDTSSPFVTVTYFDTTLEQVLTGATLWITSLDPAALTLPSGRTISEELLRQTSHAWTSWTWNTSSVANDTNYMAPHYAVHNFIHPTAAEEEEED